MTSEPRTKVIFDTNIWISYLIGHQLGELTELLTSQKIEIILSEQLRTELTEVTRRKKFQKYFSKEKVTELLKLMDFIGTDLCGELCGSEQDFLFQLNEQTGNWEISEELGSAVY